MADRTVEPAKGHKPKPPRGIVDVAPRADESELSHGTDTTPKDPCPEGTEELVPWLRNEFPHYSVRTSDPRVVDACIARAGINDLIDFIERALLAARADRKES